LPAREALDERLGHRHARRSADEHDVIDLGDVLAPVLDRELERLLASLDEVLGHPLELRTGELLLEVERTLRCRGDEREVDRGLGDLTELDLRFLRSLL